MTRLLCATAALLLSVGCGGRYRSTVPSEHEDVHSAPDYPGLAHLSDDETGGYLLEHPFETPDHVKIIRDGGLPSHCIDVLARAQWRQDIVLAFWAPAHFDNCRFGESLDYIADELNLAQHAVVSRKRDDLLVALGRALHGIQDFYAHSNYVELMADQYGDFSAVPIIPVWNAEGAAAVNRLMAANLVSGHVWWESGDKCAVPEKSHAELNKDSGKSPSGACVVNRWNMTRYRAARELAEKATKQYLHDELSRPGWSDLLSDCQGFLGYAISADNRRETAQP